MNIDSVYSSLKEMGLNIEDYETFISFVKDNNNSYEEVINMIINAKEAKDKKVNYSDFEKNLVDYFKEIQSIINKDSLYTFSNDEDITKFKNFFQKIVDKYIIIYKLKDDKDECKKVHDEIEKIKEEIDRYNSTSLTPELLSKISDLKFNLDLKSMEYRRLLSSIEESTKLMTKYSNKSEFINLINIISKDMDTLSDIMNNLSLTSESISSISKVLGNITYYFETVEIECINDINRYNDICVNAGLVKPKEENELDSIIEEYGPGKYKLIPSLDIGDYVTYNGSKSYIGNDNSDKLVAGKIYKISNIGYDNTGNEEFYLEGYNMPFSVTLFDMATEKEYNENKEVDSIIEEYGPGKYKLIPSLDIGDYVKYNGSKSYVGNDNSDKLVAGKVYKISNIGYDNTGNEEFYLEGYNMPFSVTLFDMVTEKEYNNQLDSNKVIDSQKVSSNNRLKNIYATALNNLSSKNILSHIKSLLSYNNAYSDDGLLNLEEFSDIYNEAKRRTR